jgi:alpha-beta hydrolase superfamily lysophospholipase
MPTGPAVADWDSGTGLKGYAWHAAEPRAAVLMSHGYAEHALRYVAHYSCLVPHLVAAGISVYALDMRGHGGSPGRRGGVDVSEEVRAHGAARRALSATGRPLFLFGHSLGGLVTAASVARDPRGVAGVVLSSPALLVPSGAALRRVTRLLARLMPALGVRTPEPPEGLSRLPEEVAAFAADPMIYRGRIQAILAASTLAVSHESWSRYPGWDLPTLLFHGTADRFTDPEGSERFAATIRSPDKQFIRVPEGRHELLNDEGREALLETVLAWLRQRLP